MRRWRFEALLAALAAGILGFANIARGEAYHWIGGDSGEWNNGNNWSLTEGGEAAGTYPQSAEDDTASFVNNASVAMTANVNVGTLMIADDVRVQLSSSDYNVLQVGEVAGEATSTLALSDVIVIPAVAGAPIAGQIELVADTKNGLYGASGKNLNVDGKLTGTGEVYFRNYATKGGRGGVLLNGDNSQFAGVAHILMGEGQDMRGSSGYASVFKWTTLESGSANARWIIEGSDNTNGPQFPAATLTSAENPFRLGTIEGDKSVAGGANANFYLELGGANIDFEYGGTIKRGSSSNGIKLAKVGSGTMTFSGSLEDRNTTSSVTIEDGAVKFATASSLPAAGIILAGGTLKAGMEDNAKIDLSAKISTGSTAAVIYDDEGEDSVWASLGAVTTGLVKKGAGTLTLSAAPSYTGPTTVAEGALVVLGGTTLETLSIAEGASLIVNASDGETLTVNGFAEGTSADDVTIPVGFSAAWEEVGGVWTATISKVDAPYIWTDATGDHQWSTGGNWTIGGQTATFAPDSEAQVVFPAEGSPVGGWTVELGGITRTVEKVTVDGETRFSGNALAPHTVDGAGKIVFGDDFMLVNASNEETLVIDNPVEVAAADETPATVYWTGNNRSIKLNGALTGSGTLVTRPASQANYSGVHFAGDASGFSGKIVAEANDIDRNMTNFESVDSVSENAAYQVTSGSGKFFSDSGTFRFGALSGKITQNEQTYYRNLTIEIGKLGLDDTLRGTFFNTAYPSLVSSRGHTIRKIGEGRLVFSGSLVKAYEVNGGELELTADSTVRTTWDDGASKSEAQIAFGGGTLKLDGEVTLDLSANIVNSASAIAIDDGGVDRTWATALAASNTDGLVKKGAGTLTLSAVPQYKGVTFVKEGTLAVPLATELTTSPDTVLAYTDSTYKYYTHSEGAFLDPEALAAEKCTVTIDNLVYTNGTLVSYSSSYPVTYFGENYPLGLWAKNVTITVTPGSGYKNGSVSVNGVEHASPVEYAVSAADIAKGTLAITGLVEKIVYVSTTLDLGDGLTFIDFSYGGETYDSAEALAAAKIDRDDVAGANQLTVRVSLDTLHEIKSVSGLLSVGESEGVYTYNVMSTALTGTATITTRLCDNWKVTAPKVEHATIALTTGTAVDTDENDERIVYTFFDSESVTITYSPDSGYCLSGTAVFSWDKLASDQTIDPPTVSEASITIGGVGYATMAEAVANLSDGDTLTITSDDAFADAKLTISGLTGVTVDLSGAEYSNAKIVAAASATVTVKNGTINATGATSAAMVAEDHAALILENMTITTDAPIAVGADGAALEIDEDTVITASGEGAVGVWMEAGGTLTVAGTVTAANGTGVIQRGGVATTVKATANVSAKYAAVEVRGGSLTVENGATLTTTGDAAETLTIDDWDSPAKYSAKVFVATDAVSGIGSSTLLIPAALKNDVKIDNLYPDSQVYTVDEISTELTAALSAMPLSSAATPSTVSLATKSGLSYGIVAVADLSELATATPENWTEGDGNEQEITVPQISGGAVFYRLVATPTAEVK